MRRAGPAARAEQEFAKSNAIEETAAPSFAACKLQGDRFAQESHLFFFYFGSLQVL